jgi:hypothetical protein
MTTDVRIEPHSPSVRPATRNAWNALRAAGELPSVRKLQQAVGGTNATLVSECRQLRIEEDRPAVATLVSQDESPSEDTPDTPESIVGHPGGQNALCPATAALDEADALLDLPAATAAVAAAEGAVAMAEAQRERLAAAVQQARQDHEQCEQRVLALHRQMIAGALVETALVAARNERLLAHLQVGDMQTLLREQEASVHQAEDALTLAAQRLEVTRYNAMACGRAPLLAHVDAALTGLETALQELMTHDASQHALAGELAFGDLLSATPLFAPHERHTSHFGLVNLWLYSRLAPLIPAPERAIKHPVLVSSLPEVDVASTPLSWSVYQRASDPERRILIRLVPSEDPRAVNAISLVRYGLPGVLSTLQPVAVSPGQWRAIHHDHPNTQVVDEAPSGRRAMPLQMDPFPDGSDQPMFDLSQNDYDLDAMDDQGDVQ